MARRLDVVLVKSLVGAIPALQLVWFLTQPRAAGRAETLTIRGSAKGGAVPTHYRLRAVFCPACGRHRTEAVDAQLEWPASIPHEGCPDGMMIG